MGQTGKKAGLNAARFAVALGAATLWWLPLPADASLLHVSLNGKRVQVDGKVTVQDVLTKAGLTPTNGHMRSFATGEVIPGQIRRYQLLRDGQPARLADVVRSGDRLQLINGKDFTEPVQDEILPVPTLGLPDVETQIWTVPKPGKVLRRVGVFSGQTGADEVIEPPLPAAPEARPNVLLSFDDGPEPRWTPQVLEILKAKDVKAVFCLVGLQMARYPDLVKRIHAEGHTLCDHTMTHDMGLNRRPNARVTFEIETPFNMIKELTGVAPKFYRGAGGTLSPFIISEAHRLGMRVLNWSVDPGDYHKPGAEKIQDRVVANMKQGGVALLHDGGGDRSQTVTQLPGLIDRLRAEGYSLVVG